MDFLFILKKKSRLFYAFAASLGIVNSIAYSGILIIINSVLSGAPLPFLQRYPALLFIGMILLSLGSNRVFRTYMVRVTNEILFDFESTVIQKLRRSPLKSVEAIGHSKVYTAVADAKMLGRAPEVLVEGINSGVILVCGLSYLFYVSPAGGAVVLTLMLGLLVIYLLRNQHIENELNKIRDLQNDFYRYLHDLLNGFREVKMSRARNDNMYHLFMETNLQQNQRLQNQTSIQYTDNEMVGTYSWFVIIGLVLFTLPGLLNLSMAEVSVFVVTILYLMRPVVLLVGVLPVYSRMKIALQRLDAFARELSAETTAEAAPTAHAPALPRHFSKLRFEGVTYSYTDGQTRRAFTLGPVSLEIEQGEIVFITGGNGSGKSTFVNLLTGLYPPDEGTIWLDDRPLPRYYNESVSAIFTNNHLFSENYDQFDIRRDNPLLQEYLAFMQLNGIVDINEQRGVLDARLSKGQQKRVALILALLEDKPVLVLDEWAAEQDPEFRAYFYTVILPRLKEMNKTVVAVTHDDRFFGCADRVLKFDYGQVTEAGAARPVFYSHS